MLLEWNQKPQEPQNKSLVKKLTSSFIFKFNCSILTFKRNVFPFKERYPRILTINFVAGKICFDCIYLFLK